MGMTRMAGDNSDSYRAGKGGVERSISQMVFSFMCLAPALERLKYGLRYDSLPDHLHVASPVWQRDSWTSQDGWSSYVVFPAARQKAS